MGGSAFGSTIQQRSALEFNTFGRNPNDYVNGVGRLNGDIGWQFKLQFVWQMPAGFIFSTSMDHREGGAPAAAAEHSGLGDRHFLERDHVAAGLLRPAAQLHHHRRPPGRRTSSWAAASACRSSWMRLNLNNEDANQAVQSTNVSSGVYQYPTIFAQPQAVHAGSEGELLALSHGLPGRGRPGSPSCSRDPRGTPLTGSPPWPLAFLLSLGLTSAAEPARADAAARADLVLVNGKVITVDPQDRVAQGVAVRAGRIVAVGADAEVRALVGPGTRIVDLRGRTATPGLIDSHCHFDGTDLLYELDLNYPTVKSVADIVAKVRERAATTKPGEWIRGRGWDEGKLTEKRYVLAADLDAVAPDHPVYLTHTMGHYAAANSRALALAKVGRETSDPKAGTIDRLPDGQPSGVLKEAAMGLVSGLIPEYTEDQKRKGLLEIIAQHNREGMTAVKDPGIFADEWERYRRLRAEDKLTVRVFALWRLRDGDRRRRAGPARPGPGLHQPA